MVRPTDAPEEWAPERLREIFILWERRGRERQRGFEWDVASWVYFLPDFSDLFGRMPNPVDRHAVINQVEEALLEENPLEAFVAVMVWGYGRVGYGAFRAARVLAENRDPAQILGEAAARVRRDGGPAAFSWLARNRLKWLGASFATKYLYFCGVGSGVTPPALVLDRWVRAWLFEYTGWQLRSGWHPEEYRRYITALTGWAVALGASPYDVEYLLYADVAGSRPSRLWGPAAASPAPEPRLRLGPESVAVLEAFDEAADAFAELSASRDAADVEDFERGLRQLRRIVLTPDV